MITYNCCRLWGFYRLWSHEERDQDAYCLCYIHADICYLVFGLGSQYLCELHTDYFEGDYLAKGTDAKQWGQSMQVVRVSVEGQHIWNNLLGCPLRSKNNSQLFNVLNCCLSDRVDRVF